MDLDLHIFNFLMPYKIQEIYLVQLQIKTMFVCIEYIGTRTQALSGLKMKIESEYYKMNVK